MLICIFNIKLSESDLKSTVKGKHKLLVQDKAETSAEISSEITQVNLPLFNFEKLAIATNNFYLSNKLGEGGFGPVYEVTFATSCCSL